jgi:hypothetical protein
VTVPRRVIVTVSAFDAAAPQFGEPPVLHLNDEYADLRKDRDQVRIAPPHHRLVIDEAIVGSRANVAKTRLSPAVLDAGNVSGIISAMASGNAICLG